MAKMTPLTIYILIDNNEETLRLALESVSGLPAQTLVASLNTRDKSVEICQEFGAEVFRLTERDRSKARNHLLSRSNTDWHLWLEPYEFIIQGQDIIRDVVLTTDPAAFRVSVFEKEIVTKQTRLWSKKLNLKFTNPIYETLTDVASTPLAVSIWAGTSTNDRIAQLENWYKAKPADLEPNYYLACVRFSQQKYKDFLSLAEQYVFRQSKMTVSNTMLRYYMGMVHCYITKNISQALQQAIICVAQHPLMAEFWCLMGDIHIQISEYTKAISMYENAIFLGGKRLQDDEWPIHVAKYKAYPEEMITKCHKFLNNSKVLFGNQ